MASKEIELYRRREIEVYQAPIEAELLTDPEYPDDYYEDVDWCDCEFCDGPVWIYGEDDCN